MTDSGKKTHYPELDPNPDFPKIEESVIAHWKKEGLFQRSIDNRPAKTPASQQTSEPSAAPHVSDSSRDSGGKTNNEYVFYDGPPFANGLPHYGHLLTGYVKDLYARYQTMRGKRVERRFGWDCHGLPAEMGSEKELGISGRAAITNYGIGKFNEHCRTSVMKYSTQWEDYVTRQARWVDFENDYKTMDTSFMESVLWAFKQLFDKGLIYEAHRVMPYSWAAETPLSNFETKLDNSYREREDKAITVAFELNEPPKKIRDEYPKQKIVALAWTTTPWTLPSNLALAVSEEVEYVAVRGDRSVYILSRSAYKDKYESLIAPMMQEHESEKKIEVSHFSLTGKDLIGLTYKPLFPYFKDHPNSFKILDGSSFIEEGSGTGVVHMAPGFGEDDQRVCKENGIEVIVPVDGQGKFTDEIFDLDEPALSLKGLNVIAQTEGQCKDEPYKPEQLKKYGLVNLRIINWLKMTGQLIKQEDYKHNYPHCWRTDQPLIYRAMPSWYVEVTKFRDRAVELNKEINWIPEHIGPGQMEHMLATAPDWSISRNRFWGTPIPIWRSKSGKLIAIGSIAELEELSGQKVEDLHRPYIDNITITKDGEEYSRVEDVFDCWFESGSMPFAQVHYPFENKDWFDTHFPADFITEYVGQTRGWFNTLIMLSTALFDKPPFKNCICHGVVLDSETGLKYSKRLKNYKDPMEVMDKYGADALRWLMISSPVMRGMDLAVDPEGKFIRDVVRLAIKPIWNAYNFFCLYANADGLKAELKTDSQDVMDRYILAKCKASVDTIQTALDAYDTPAACDAVMQFFEVLNNWYIRRNKERFWLEHETLTLSQRAHLDLFRSKKPEGWAAKKEREFLEENIISKKAAYDTLYTVLVTMCEAASPLLPLSLDEIYIGLTGKESVHTADFPDVSTWPFDQEVMVEMDWAQDVCNVALAIRNQVNIRVRQPLARIQCVGKVINNRKIQTIICEEVNVRAYNLSSDDIEKYATHKLSINNKALGKRLPAMMKQIIPASKKGEWEPVGDFGIKICGEELQSGEFTLQLEPKKEYADCAQALSTNDALVILDTEITPELEAEGIARDMVRAIQQTRKDADYNVSDRINLHLDAPDEIAKAILTHKDYVMEQTLSVDILDAKPTADSFSSESMVGEQKVIISIARAA